MSCPVTNRRTSLHSRDSYPAKVPTGRRGEKKPVLDPIAWTFPASFLGNAEERAMTGVLALTE